MTDYDSPWKQMLAQYFQEFLAFFFPRVHAGIDWTRPWTFLDKELQKIVRDATLGQRRADQLVSVVGQDGAEDRLLVHIEVQGDRKAELPQRMFVYNYRAYDLYGQPVVSLAVLGESYPRRYGKFGYGRWGSLMRLRFPVVSLAAYRERWAELDASTNPFAVVTQAHLKAQEMTGADDPTRYQAKLGLIRSLYRRGYERQAILDLFRFIDWVLELPDGLENQLWTEVAQLDEVNRMEYLASFERKALQQGIEQGIEQGRVKFFSFLLQQRFGELPGWVEVRLQQAEPANLETWGLRMLSAQRLEDVFTAGNEPAGNLH